MTSKPKKTTQLKRMVQRQEMAFLMEAHNGLSAKVAEEAGFEGIWGSGLSISAALGVRDHNEASWTQVLEVAEFMSDATTVPILLDGDTGYGDFNTMQRVVRKLEQRGVAGVCIEDKIFPKTNSFIRGAAQPLAGIDEFAGKIKAGKDAQWDEDFVIVARVEAFIAGWGIDEAMKRAEAYRLAGADAILMHSALRSPVEILAFVKEWGNRLPVVIVPTKYYQTPTEVFRDAGVSVVIWANHLMRSSLAAMQATAKTIYTEQTLLSVEEKVAPLADVFRLQGENELEQAEKRYLPKHGRSVKAVILAASQGAELGELTRDRPKAMVSLAGKPLLAHILETYRSVNVKELSVVRGYKKDAVNLPNVKYFDNDQFATTQEVSSLAAAAEALEGDVIVSYGDVLLKKYILQELIDTDDDIVIMVDSNHAESRNRGRNADFVSNSEPNSRRAYQNVVTLKGFRPEREDAVHGEWMGIVKLSPAGTKLVREKLKALAAEPARLATMKLPDLLQLLVADGAKVRVIYTTGHWLDVDSVEDVVVGAAF
ncbi:MAG: phosphoenolpyruvate mutase [Deltaproteobacteria bacterium]|nr:phosphoenolpyruvate mutase [Deltaproteobacteria bacterium]